MDSAPRCFLIALEFAKLLDGLSPAAKAVWTNAKAKEFDIGIQGGLKPNPAEWVLDHRVIDVVARLGAHIRITVYSPELPPLTRRGRS
jgi:hypothetical protein